MTARTVFPHSTDDGSADPTAAVPSSPVAAPNSRLKGKRAAMVVFSRYPSDPRPRRAVKTLLQEGMSVDLICEAEEGSPSRQVSGDLEIIRLPIQHYRGGVISYFYQYFAFTLWAAALLACRTLRRRYHLVYVHNMPDVLVACATVPKLFGAKIILDQHDPMPELMKTIFGLDERSLATRVIKCLERWSIARAHLVITVNAACKRIFASRSCCAEKIGIVMNVPDSEIFTNRPATSYLVRKPGAGFVVMYHGSLVERNGIDLLVDAMIPLQNRIPGMELRVYGRSTPYFETVMEKVRRLRLDNWVRAMGPKSLEELVHEIEDCDVGVIPNRRNDFTNINSPTRIFEYLSLGKPVIAPSTPGIQDYFDSESLFFFDAGNLDELTQTLLEVYSHPEKAVEVASKGQDVYLKHHWKEERQALVDLVSGLFTPRKSLSLSAAPVD